MEHRRNSTGLIFRCFAIFYGIFLVILSFLCWSCPIWLFMCDLYPCTPEVGSPRKRRNYIISSLFFVKHLQLILVWYPTGHESFRPSTIMFGKFPYTRVKGVFFFAKFVFYYYTCPARLSQQTKKIIPTQYNQPHYFGYTPPVISSLLCWYGTTTTGTFSHSI